MKSVQMKFKRTLALMVATSAVILGQLSNASTEPGSMNGLNQVFEALRSNSANSVQLSKLILQESSAIASESSDFNERAQHLGRAVDSILHIYAHTVVAGMHTYGNVNELSDAAKAIKENALLQGIVRNCLLNSIVSYSGNRIDILSVLESNQFSFYQAKVKDLQDKLYAANKANAQDIQLQLSKILSEKNGGRSSLSMMKQHLWLKYMGLKEDMNTMKYYKTVDQYQAVSIDEMMNQINRTAR